MSEQRDNSGAVFVNDRKESDNHPDRTGSAMIGGVEYWVNGWIKKSGDKPPFLSLSFKPKDQQKGSTNKVKQPAKSEDDPW
jgi:hypothetical protein